MTSLICIMHPYAHLHTRTISEDMNWACCLGISFCFCLDSIILLSSATTAIRTSWALTCDVMICYVLRLFISANISYARSSEINFLDRSSSIVSYSWCVGEKFLHFCFFSIFYFISLPCFFFFICPLPKVLILGKRVADFWCTQLIVKSIRPWINYWFKTVGSNPLILANICI